MDHEKLASQLIRALRGQRSQNAFSRHLGFKCNVLYTWESGRRFPTAATFLRLARKAKVDVGSGITEFLGAAPKWLGDSALSDAELVTALLGDLQSGTTRVEIAKRMGTNRVSVSRWLSGQAEPRLPEWLRMIEATSARLLDFIAVFVDPLVLAEARADWLELQAQRKVAYDLPWSHAVMRCLEVESYQALPKHVTGWVAARLGITQQEELLCLRALVSARLIRKRRGRWAVEQVLTVDTTANPAASRRMKAHWAGVGLSRLPGLEPNKHDLFSCNLFSVSESEFSKIRELHIAYYHELRAIVAASTSAERVALVNLQLLRLDEAPVAAEAELSSGQSPSR